MEGGEVGKTLIVVDLGYYYKPRLKKRNGKDSQNALQ